MTLPNEIGHLSNLEKLALNENLIQTLPDGLSKLTKLTILDLRHNKLSEVRVAARHRRRTRTSPLQFTVHQFLFIFKKLNMLG